MLIPQVAIFLQRFTDDLSQLHRDFPIQPLRCHRFPIQDRVVDRRFAVAAERLLSCRHLVQHCSEGEQVGAIVEFLGPRLLRRHVGHRPQRGSSTRQRLERQCRFFFAASAR
jgi:hypothetical protein